VPLSKAGVGSAVNDTTRELGGALGIAILGSIANSAYRAGIDLTGLGLGATARSQGEDSIGTAARVAGTVPGGEAIKAHAAAAFTHAFNVASAVSVGLAAGAAVAVLLLSRRKGDDTVHDIVEDFRAGEPDLGFAMVPVRSRRTRE
jgi:hypothetical protein